MSSESSKRTLALHISNRFIVPVPRQHQRPILISIAYEIALCKLQINRLDRLDVLAAKEIFNIIKNNIKSDSTILDAYAGVGAIGIWLKDKAKHITYIEENLEASKLAKDNYKLNKIENYEIFRGDAKKHFLNFGLSIFLV